MFRFLKVAAAALLAMSMSVAQTPANQGGMGKMGGHGESHPAAENPAHRYFLGVYALPEMQEELGLSAQQVAQLRQDRQEFASENPAKGTERQLAAAEAVGNMKAVLTPAQQEKFAAIQPADLHVIAMVRLTAEDSAKLMAELSGHEEAAGMGMKCKMMGGDEAAGADHTGEAHSHH